MSDVWTYREGILGSDVSAQNLVGYGVEAEDGSIGKVDELDLRCRLFPSRG